MERNLPLRVMPFYTGLYKAVDDPSSDSIISWSSNNRSFIIWDHREFERKIISTCGLILCTDFLDFLSELKIWGFRRVMGSAHRLEFGRRGYFVRGRPDLLKMMQNSVVARRGLKLREKEAREKELTDGLHHLRV